MQSPQPHRDLVLLSLPAKGQRQFPPLRIDAEDVLELIDAADRAPAEAHDFVPLPEAAAIGLGAFENLIDNHGAVVVAFDGGPERGVVDNPSAAQMTEEVSH